MLRPFQRAVRIVEPVGVMALREHTGALQRAPQFARRADMREQQLDALLAGQPGQLGHHQRAGRVDHRDAAQVEDQELRAGRGAHRLERQAIGGAEEDRAIELDQLDPVAFDA